MEEVKLNKLPLEEPEHVTRLHEQRMTVCYTCDRRNSLNFCNECGCLLSVKTRMPWVKCPLGKW